MTRSGSLVAGAMVTMSVVTYAFNLIAARWLIPAEFGALTALLSVILIANVVSLGIQSAVARRIAVDKARAAEVITTAARVSPLVAITVGALVSLSAVVLAPALQFDSSWPLIFCGAMMIPLTHMGTQAGVAQGTEQWGRLSAIYLGNGFGRLFGGLLGMLVLPTATGAMAGLAVGGWLPVILGLGLLRVEPESADLSRRSLAKETVFASSTLLAYFVLSNIDALLARSMFSEFDSGMYAAGLIMTKSALFLPQFVSVVLFPAFARDSSNRSRLVAVGLVGLLGTAAIGAVLLLPNIALALVGGDQYSSIKNNLWWFALSGTTLAMVYVLVFDALARRVRGVTLVLWLATGVIAIGAVFSSASPTSLVRVVITGAGLAALALLVLPTLQTRRALKPTTGQ